VAGCLAGWLFGWLVGCLVVAGVVPCICTLPLLHPSPAPIHPPRSLPTSLHDQTHLHVQQVESLRRAAVSNAAQRARLEAALQQSEEAKVGGGVQGGLLD